MFQKSWTRSQMGAINPENTALSERHIQREGLSMHPA